MNHLKIQYFEYLVIQLIAWYKEAHGIENDGQFNRSNDLSILKAIKLCFFATANEHKTLLQVFDEFHAMALGHVEKDIYDHIKETEGDFSCFRISPSGTIIKLKYLDCLIEYNFLEEDSDVKKSIITSIETLKDYDLIKYTGYDLIQLSQHWYSWKRTFSLVKSTSFKSRKIPVQTIAKEHKFYALED